MAAYAGVSLLLRVASFVGWLVTIPILIDSLGATRYGVYAVLTGLPLFLSFSNLGIGNALLTDLTTHIATANHERAVVTLSAAFFGLTYIGLAMTALGLMVSMFVDLGWLFGQAPATETRHALAVTTVLFFLGLPLGLANRVHLVVGRSTQAALWTGGATVFSVAVTVMLGLIGANVPVLVAGTLGSLGIVDGINSLLTYRRKESRLRPSLRHVRRAEFTRLLRLGGWFTLIATVGSVAYQTDLLVVSARLGAESVADYVVPFRLFSVPVLVISLTMTPLWVAFAANNARGLYRELRRQFWLSLTVTLTGSVIASAVLIGSAGRLIHWWVGSAVDPSTQTLVIFGAYVVVAALSTCFATLLNALNCLRFQAMSGLVMAVINVPLSILLAGPFGASGPILATVVSQTLAALVPAVWLTIRRVLPGLGHSEAADVLGKEVIHDKSLAQS